MLGMMNCPTDEMEVYSTSPSMKAFISTKQHLNSPTAENDDFENALKVFSERKEKPVFMYTRDGRKMIDGKLAEGAAMESAEKMWNKLILQSMVDKILVERNATKSENCSDMCANNSVCQRPLTIVDNFELGSNK